MFHNKICVELTVLDQTHSCDCHGFIHNANSVNNGTTNVNNY